MGILLLGIVLYLQYWRKPAVASPKRKGLATPIELTDEQHEIIDGIIEIEIEDQIEYYKNIELLDDFDHEVLAALHTHLSSVTPLTEDQSIIIQDFVDIAFEEEIEILQEKETLDEEDLQILAALRLYQAVLDMPEPKHQFKLGVSIVINSIKKAIEFVRTKIGNRSVDDVDEHPLDQTALEILRHLWIVDNEIEDPEEQVAIADGEKDDQILTNVPILQLLEWSATTMEHDQKIVQIQGLPLKEMMQTLAGPHGESSPVGDYHLLGIVGTQKAEGIKTELRNSLNLILEEAEV